MKRQRNLSILAILVLVALVGYIFAVRPQSNAQGAVTAAGQGPPQSVAPIAGHVAPDFTLTDLQGRSVTLSSLRGRPVFINFFASWCPPCKAETPDLVSLYQRYGKHVRFIGVDMTPGDTLAGVHYYVQAFSVPYPVLLDRTGAVETTYGVIDIPTSFFITSSGVIMSRIVGLMSPAVMRAQFAKLLSSH
ncbi:MAG: TlpA family protein disulfide reductase [Bacilli bacterium]